MFEKTRERIMAWKQRWDQFRYFQRHPERDTRVPLSTRVFRGIFYRGGTVTRDRVYADFMGVASHEEIDDALNALVSTSTLYRIDLWYGASVLGPQFSFFPHPHLNRFRKYA